MKTSDIIRSIDTLLGVVSTQPYFLQNDFALSNFISYKVIHYLSY